MMERWWKFGEGEGLWWCIGVVVVSMEKEGEEGEDGELERLGMWWLLW